MDATQKEGSLKQLRGRSLGTKLSEGGVAHCEKSAARRGQTLRASGAASRQVLLDARLVSLKYRRPEVILSEILGPARS